MILVGCDFICEACEKIVKFPSRPHRHHRFSDTVANNKYYGHGNETDGIDWINHPDNIMYPVGECCNASHRGQGEGLEVWHELEFCRHFGIEPRSKSFRYKVMR